MDESNTAVLVAALQKREREYRNAIDRLRELASEQTEDDVHDLTRLLRESIDMVGCLRRLVPHATVNELHHAFGAPGDFGYETPIGAALDRLYRAPCAPSPKVAP